MTRLRYLLLPLALLLVGCGADIRAQSDTGRGAAPTATVTVTVAANVEVEGGPIEGSPHPTEVMSPEDGGKDSMPQLELEVFQDGCGVIRSEAPEGVHHENLTWSFLDRDGFQVLGRNAEGETRYRYFAPGTYTVLLEAWGGESYVPVSNEVTVHC